jgi:hypothetical protein
MGKVWVQAITNYHLDDHGKLVTKVPGDWFELGGQDAKNAQAAGQIVIHNPVYRDALIPPESGIVLRKPIKFVYESVPITVSATPVLPYSKNLIWHPDFGLDVGLIPVGLSLLDRWEIAVPISDYNLLARDIGTDEEREQTVKVIHDLRVPVYDTRLIFARNCLAIQQLFEAWLKEAGDERLSFLRCLYQIKPYVLALPSIWLKK